MESKIFEQLLLDLYDVYNASKKKDVERLIKNYNGREFDAIKTILLKYNYKGHPGYSEDANRDEYISFLINKYSDGDRPLSQENRIKQREIDEEQREIDIKTEEENKRKELEKEKAGISNLGEEVKSAIKDEIQSLRAEMEKKITSRMEELDKYFNKKKLEFEKREQAIKSIESNILDFSGQTQYIEPIIDEEEKIYTKINIENLNFTDSDIKLPPEEVLGSLAKGTRIILKSSEGKVCGVEVKDITIDLVSYNDDVVKEVILERI